LSYTYVDDEALKVITLKCRGLLQLLLEDCCNVTEKGVKHVRPTLNVFCIPKLKHTLSHYQRFYKSYVFIM